VVDLFFAHGPAAHAWAARIGLDDGRLRDGRSSVEGLSAAPLPGLPAPRLTFAGRFRADKAPDVLLWLSRVRAAFLEVVSGVENWGMEAGQGCWIADKTGTGRSGRGQALMRSRPAGHGVGPGAAGGSFEGQHVCGSRIVGQAAPGSWCQLARSRRQG
jgi:hypothetical protein